jgi:hypothetical protein
MDTAMFLFMKHQKLTLTLQTACEEIGIAIGTAYNRISSNTFELPTQKEGNNHIVDVRDVAEYIDTRRKAALKKHQDEQRK